MTVSAAPLETPPSRCCASRSRRCSQKLPERERKIIQLRYGLKDGRYRTLEEVGVEFGITRERIRQIEAGGCASCATRTMAEAARLPRIS